MFAAPLTVNRQWGTVASRTASSANTPAPLMDAVSIACVNLSMGSVMVTLLLLLRRVRMVHRPDCSPIAAPARGPTAAIHHGPGRTDRKCGMVFDDDLAVRIRELV